ncbi:MAG: phospholipase D-like domain-containing protein [Candidatus Acidiferrales bacterium]
MASVTAKKGSFSVRAHVGDFKTLLAFNLASKSDTKNLAGFTMQVEPQGKSPFFILNELQFKTPGDHAQDGAEPARSSINAPIHKFRWVHVPGSFHQGMAPFIGPYTYTVTPRFFDNKQSMMALDPANSVSVTVNVAPFAKGDMELGFTRGWVQSQAFVNHFGQKGLIRPKGNALQFDTSVVAGQNAKGEQFTFVQEFTWSGFTAREKIFAILNAVLADSSLHLDMFAYDLNEPDVVNILLQLAKAGRMRIILDNASLHHNSGLTKPEDQLEKLFNAQAKAPAEIKRGKFGRFAHDKVLIVSKGAGSSTASRVLTGSTNFSVTGMYVNSNHIVVFNDANVATQYLKVFNESWADGVSEAFQNSALAAGPFPINSPNLPRAEITFSPHQPAEVTTILNGMIQRIQQEKTVGSVIGSVLFAVMQIDDKSLDTTPANAAKVKVKKADQNPLFTVLNNLHAEEDIFSYGISDSPGGIFLYKPGQATGVLVTGKPGASLLPPPFNQVPLVAGHQIHHKFVVCGFNGENPVVYCGSSNLANGGEHVNGDNLLAIHDGDVATAFAIEAVALVDHFNFLDSAAQKAKAAKLKPPAPTANLHQAAIDAGWFLSTTDAWAAPFYNPKDLHSMDRQLFG